MSRFSRRTSDAVYHAAHREERRAYSVAYREAHREEVAARNARYYAAHREEARAKRVADPDAYACRNAYENARKRWSGESPSREEWDAVWYGPCFACGVTPARGVDHIVPKSKGGRNVPENLQPACWPHNKEKGAKHSLRDELERTDES